MWPLPEATWTRSSDKLENRCYQKSQPGQDFRSRTRSEEEGMHLDVCSALMMSDMFHRVSLKTMVLETHDRRLELLHPDLSATVALLRSPKMDTLTAQTPQSRELLRPQCTGLMGTTCKLTKATALQIPSFITLHLFHQCTYVSRHLADQRPR
jgi:hypothetical protein